MSIGLFVDIQSVYSRVSYKFDRKTVDYRKIMSLAQEFGTVEQAVAYGSQIDNTTNKFVSCLKKLGYLPKFRNHIVVDGKIVKKVTWDVDIVFDILNSIEQHSTVILVTANNRFAPLIAYIRRVHPTVNVILIGCELSLAMKESCNLWYDIDARLFEEKGVWHEDQHQVDYPALVESFQKVAA